MKLPVKFIGAGAVAAVAVGLVGCASTPSDEDVTLTWWATQQSASVADSEAVWNEIADRYTEETGVEVEVEVIPWADLYNKILTAVSSGTGPDVLNIGTSWTASLHDTGAFSPITGDNLEAMGGSDRFVQAAYDAAHVPDEDQTAVPIMSSVYSLYYNTVLFEAAGITEPPATWEEFVEVGKQLTQDTDGDGTTDQWGYTASVAALTSNSHQAFTYGQQEGGAFVDADGNATLSSPEQAAGIELYVNLMTEDGIQAPSDAEIDLGADAVDNFINGKAGMIFQQNPVEQFLSRDFTDWAIAPMPVIEGGEDVQSMVAGTNMVVFDESPYKQQAFELIGHITSPEEQSFIADSFRALPVVTEAYDLAPFSENGDETVAIRQEILANASAPFPLVPNIGEIEQAVGDAMRLAYQAFATGGDPDLQARLEAADDQLN